MNTISDILKRAISVDLDDEPVTLGYVKDGPAEQPMIRSLRGWLKDYLSIKAKRKVKWKSRKKIDPNGGDLVRIWTEDLKGTVLEDDCDWIVWQTPDDTIGRDIAKFLSNLS